VRSTGPTPGSPASTSTARSASASSASPISTAPPLPTISSTVPWAIFCPLAMTTTWLQVCSISLSRWLETMTVRPVRA
jgi:hypothetical protein